MSEQDLLKENRFLRQKLMQLQNLFLQLVIACCNQPNNINALFSNITAVLNEASNPTASPTSEGQGAVPPASSHQQQTVAAIEQPATSLPAPSLPVTGLPDQSFVPTQQLVPASGPAQSGRPVVQMCLETAHQALSVMCEASAQLDGVVMVHNSDSGPSQNDQLLPTADITLPDVPSKPFLDYLCTIEEIWREYKYGDVDAKRPGIRELDNKYGDKWRKKEYVRDGKELKSRQNLYNKRKCVWIEVQYLMGKTGVSEADAVDKLQREVNDFGKGLSRFIDTILRERQKGRRVDFDRVRKQSGDMDDDPEAKRLKSDSGQQAGSSAAATADELNNQSTLEQPHSSDGEPPSHRQVELNHQDPLRFHIQPATISINQPENAGNALEVPFHNNAAAAGLDVTAVVQRTPSALESNPQIA